MIKKIFELVTCLVAWDGILLSVYSTLSVNSLNLFSSLVEVFSYFTVLSNLLIAIFLSFIIICPKHILKEKGKIIFLGSITNITITALVYHFLLAAVWKSSGIVLTQDLILHYLIAVLYLSYLLIFVRNIKLKYRYVFIWLIVPLIYLILILIKGSITNNYQYPFLNLNVLGYLKVILNVFFISLAFVLVGSFFVFINQNIFNKKA